MPRTKPPLQAREPFYQLALLCPIENGGVDEAEKDLETNLKQLNIEPDVKEETLYALGGLHFQAPTTIAQAARRRLEESCLGKYKTNPESIRAPFPAGRVVPPAGRTGKPKLSPRHLQRSGNTQALPGGAPPLAAEGRRRILSAGPAAGHRRKSSGHLSPRRNDPGAVAPLPSVASTWANTMKTAALIYETLAKLPWQESSRRLERGPEFRSAAWSAATPL